MIEIFGNLWDQKADAICITTNGYITKSSRAVMGRGCAKEAKDKFQDIEYTLAYLINLNGNRVQIIDCNRTEDTLVSFPVKHHWREEADSLLIERSCQQLVDLANNNNWFKIILPRPGCGNGKLHWMSKVKPICEKYLDDRFYVINRG